MNESSHTQLVNEAMRAFMDIVIARQFADVPNWITLDLTISQLRAIFLLAHHGALAVGELAGLLGIGNPAASILVQQLVEHELVERSEDIQDRRRTLVSLTGRGTRLVSGRREQREANLRRWLGQLGNDELTGLLRGLRALVEIVRSEEAQAGHPAEPIHARVE